MTLPSRPSACRQKNAMATSAAMAGRSSASRRCRCRPGLAPRCRRLLSGTAAHAAQNIRDSAHLLPPESDEELARRRQEIERDRESQNTHPAILVISYCLRIISTTKISINIYRFLS
jgi:hypothetical protein